MSPMHWASSRGAASAARLICRPIGEVHSGLADQGDPEARDAYGRVGLGLGMASSACPQRIRESCTAVNIIVTIMKWPNCRFSVIKSKELVRLWIERRERA